VQPAIPHELDDGVTFFIIFVERLSCLHELAVVIITSVGQLITVHGGNKRPDVFAGFGVITPGDCLFPKPNQPSWHINGTLPPSTRGPEFVAPRLHYTPRLRYLGSQTKNECGWRKTTYKKKNEVRMT